jgi:hypothetical protein
MSRPSSVPPPPSSITVKVKAVTKDPHHPDYPENPEWIMGDILELTIDPAAKFKDLALMIKEIKGIPLVRMNFVLPPARSIQREKWEKTLRQVGVYNKGTLRLEPTMDGGWEWEKIEYYWGKVIEDLEANIDPKEGTSFDELNAKVELPPTMRGTKLQDFIRKYPDKFHMEVNTSGKNDMWVKIQKKGDRALPTWV